MKGGAEFVKPKDDREARVWNFFNRQDDFWPIREWPLWAQRVALMEHKKHDDRFSLFRFLVFNGLEPQLSLHWVKCKDYRGRIIEEHYDRSAESSFAHMLRRALNGELLQQPRPRIYDMILGRPD